MDCKKTNTMRAVFAAFIILQCSIPGFAQWTTSIPDNGAGAENVGAFGSLAIVDGKPAISYSDATNGDLKYVRALDASGTGWAEPITIDAVGNVGGGTSLSIIDGNPAIAYSDSDNHDLKYVRAENAIGTVWGAPLSLDVAADAGLYPCLMVVNGNPAIAHYGPSFGRVRYLRATDAIGSAWAEPILVDTTSGHVGQYLSMAIVDGNPAISYYNNSPNSDLKYVRATDASGTTWGTAIIVDTAAGIHTSLAVVNGNPAIAYQDASAENLKYVRATDASGSSWAAPITLDVAGVVGAYTSLEVINANPAISYYDATTGNLKFVRATNATGTLIADWGAPASIDSLWDAGRFTSLELVDGNPAISYFDYSHVDLKYIRATDATGAAWGSPATPDSGGPGIVGSHTSLAIVNGKPAIAYRSETSDALKYVSATDATGTAWGEPMPLAGNAGKFNSLAVVNGNPAISFSGSRSSLYYVRASNASGTAWSPPVLLHSILGEGQYTSLAVVAGNPAVSYFNEWDTNLYYVRATNVSGTSWGAPAALDWTGVVGQYTSLAVVNGNPAISYYDASTDELQYVRAADSTGAVLGTPLVVDTDGNVGLYTSLEVVSGNPAISYYDAANLNLKYVRATNASGSVWGTPVVVDSVGSVGQYTSLAVVNGVPAISYYDVSNSDLKYVRASDATGSAWDPPVTIDREGDVGRYATLAVASGAPAIAYYDATKGDLKYVHIGLGASPTPTASPSATASPTASPSPTLSPSPTPGPCDSVLEIANPFPAESGYFGNVVDISGELIIVGAQERNAKGVDYYDGLAYIHDATTGARLFTLTNPDPNPDDYFGMSVAISGTLAVVGAQYADPDGVGETGIAYVFNATTGALVTTLHNPAPEQGDNFGSSVAISGELAIVMAGADDPAGVIDAGTAYVFNATTGALVTTLNNPTPAEYEYFAVGSISGNLAVVGAPQDNPGGVPYAGTAYVFNATTGAQVSTLNNPNPASDDGFGGSVGISGNLAVVGAYADSAGGVDYAGAAYVFDASTGNLRATLTDLQPVQNATFGASVAISGNAVVVGSPWGNFGEAHAVGIAHMFDASSGAFVTSLYDRPPSVSEGGFGRSVAIFGNVAVVGSPFKYESDIPGVGEVQRFACLPLDNALISNHSIPSQLPQDDPMPVTITVRNAGAVNWSAGGGYTLMELADTCGLSPGTEIALAPGATVPSGSPHVFAATLSPVSVLGPCNLQYQMAHNGTPFGEALNVMPQVVGSVNDADITGHTFPPTMAPGQQLWVGVNVKNTGNTAWVPGENRVLGVFGSDACSLFGATRFAPTAMVLPGQTSQFLVQIAAPAAPGSCSFTLKMVEEFVAWFGDPLELTINVAEPPNASGDWTVYQ